MVETYSLSYTGMYEFSGRLELLSGGCGCCSSSDEVTPKTIKDAIEDAEKWLAYLRAVEKSLKQQQGDS
jgi:Fe-S cluster biogenesis protein NfuA